MKVEIIGTTSYAKEILIFSKKTRLNMNGDAFIDILNMEDDEKNKELEYVFNTIGSSLEFVDYTIMITGVTRALTHQLVRHRVGVSFAQQSMRTVDMSDFEYLSPDSVKSSGSYHSAMNLIKIAYSNLIDSGVKPEDARGILPANIKTNILMKINLRALSDLLSVRLCVKSQGEFRELAVMIKKSVLNIHPWAEKILQSACVLGHCKFNNNNFYCPVKEAGLTGYENKDQINDLLKGV